MRLNKIILISISIIFIYGCGPKREIAFKDINVFGEDITLNNPIYRENKVLFANLSEISPYLGGNATYSKDDDGKAAMVEFGTDLVCFTDGVSRATIFHSESKITDTKELNAKVSGRKDNMYIPINDYVEILNYTYKIENNKYYILKIN